MSDLGKISPSPNILIVDDDPDTGMLLSSLFSAKGYQVSFQNNPHRALEELQVDKPDLVILDVMMPEMDGWNVFQRIQTLKNIPVIFLSALDSSDTIARALRQGAYDFIRKPFSNQELLARIDALFRRTLPSINKSKGIFAGYQGMITEAKVSVVIPTLNEAKNLPLVLPYLPLDWIDEVILVDGHSTDGTVQIARQLLPAIRVIQEPRRGKGAAMHAGYQAATGDIIILMDADGSHDPREIPRFIHALIQGADMVKGSRFAPGGGTTDMPRFRRIGNSFLTMLVNLFFNGNLTDLCYGYHGFWRYCVDCLDTQNYPGFEIDTAIYTRALEEKLRIIEVPSFEGYRFHGSSHLKTIPDGFRVLKTILRAYASGSQRAVEPRYLGFRVPSSSQPETKDETRSR